jgi:hypothetical protein
VATNIVSIAVESQDVTLPKGSYKIADKCYIPQVCVGTCTTTGSMDAFPSGSLKALQPEGRVVGWMTKMAEYFVPYNVGPLNKRCAFWMDCCSEEGPTIDPNGGEVIPNADESYGRIVSIANAMVDVPTIDPKPSECKAMDCGCGCPPQSKIDGVCFRVDPRCDGVNRCESKVFFKPIDGYEALYGSFTCRQAYIDGVIFTPRLFGWFNSFAELEEGIQEYKDFLKDRIQPSSAAGSGIDWIRWFFPIGIMSPGICSGGNCDIQAPALRWSASTPPLSRYLNAEVPEVIVEYAQVNDIVRIDYTTTCCVNVLDYDIPIIQVILKIPLIWDVLKEAYRNVVYPIYIEPFGSSQWQQVVQYYVPCEIVQTFVGADIP